MTDTPAQSMETQTRAYIRRSGRPARWNRRITRYTEHAVRVNAPTLPTSAQTEVDRVGFPHICGSCDGSSKYRRIWVPGATR